MATIALVCIGAPKVLSCICAAVSTCALLYRFRRKIAEIIQNCVGTVGYSALVEWCSSINKAPDLREAMRAQPEPEFGNWATAHSHPQAACTRSQANVMIDEIITRGGYIPYSISMSNRDIRNHNLGTRNYHFAKDLAMARRNDTLRATHVIKLVDVDYHVELEEILEHGNPVMLYTFVPYEVAGALPNASYTIDRNDVVHVKINGGAEYDHPLWDFDDDHLIVDYWWGSQMYLVETRIFQSDLTRRLVMLWPMRTIYGPFAWIIPGKRLRHRVFNHGPINISRFQKAGDNGTIKLFVSLGVPMERIATTISETKFKIAIMRCTLAKDPAISDVERIFRTDDIGDPAYAASLFMQLWHLDRASLALLTPIVTVPKPEVVRPHYQTLAPLITEDGKSCGRVLFDPYVRDGNVLPVRSFNNDTACITGRIEQVRSNITRVPPFYRQCMNEFLEFLVPNDLVHTGVPWDIEQVEARQNRPSQRSANQRDRPFTDMMHKFICKSFQKAESYPKITDPRNISTVPTYHRLRYSSYLYPIADVLKRHDWYAFGKHPREFGKRMLEVAANSDCLIPTDYSRLDGTHSPILTEFETNVIKRYFNPIYHKEVITLQEQQVKAKAVTREGVFYNTYFTRLSGSAETSSFNSIDNALVAYVAIRHHINDPVSAYSALGVYGGDDGTTPSIPVRTYETVSAKFGLKLKAEVIQANNPITFLGRIYLDPWVSEESICDVQRQLRKLHLTIQPITVPLKLIVQRRAHAFMITDPTTPIISHWAKAVLRLYGPPDAKTMANRNLDREVSWWSQYDCPFEPPAPDDPIMWGYVAQSLNATVMEVISICNKFDDAKTWDDLLIPEHRRFDFQRKVEIDAAIDGQVINRQQVTPAAPRLPAAPRPQRSERPPVWDKYHRGTRNQPPPRRANTRAARY